MDQTLSIIFFFAAIFIVGGLMFVVIALAKRGPVGLDVDKYRSHWMTIEQQLKPEDVSSCHMCVLNADKLLGKALEERGIKGTTMGDRMKELRGKWTRENDLWSAHKLRNKIAHEPDVQVRYEDARRALAAFKQALKDVGAI